jgi:hypothetical protein
MASALLLGGSETNNRGDRAPLPPTDPHFMPPLGSVSTLFSLSGALFPHVFPAAKRLPPRLSNPIEGNVATSYRKAN